MCDMYRRTQSVVWKIDVKFEVSCQEALCQLSSKGISIHSLLIGGRGHTERNLSC
jgi:hypothetical protein